MTDDIKWGILCIMIGIISIGLTRRYPAQKPDIWHSDLRGYLGGVLFIIIGIDFLLSAIHKHP